MKYLWQTLMALLWLCGVSGVQSQVVTPSGLVLWLDARDHDADGDMTETPSGTNWLNKVNPIANIANFMKEGTVGFPSWGGNGLQTGTNAYHVKFDVANSPAVGDENGNYAVVTGSGVSTPFDDRTFTYETWVRRTGVPNSGAFVAGALVTHNSPGGNDMASIYYTSTGVDFGGGQVMPADSFFANQSSGATQFFSFPNSTGDFPLSTSNFVHIVYTRAGNGAGQSAYYMNGALQGTFQTADGGAFDANSLLTLAAQRLSGLADPGGDTTDGKFTRTYMDFDLGTFRFYGRPLTAAEIRSNFEAEVSSFIPEPSCVLLIGLGGLALLRKRRRDPSNQ